MRKLGIVLLGLALMSLWAFGALAAGKITIIIASGSKTSPSYAVLAKQAARYMKLHPDIEIKIQEMPWSSTLQHDMYTTWLTGGLPYPDILRLDIIWPAEFASAGWVIPLDEYIEAEGIDLSDFLPGPINGVTWQGKI